tara:strand:- start:340 stop:627 length:288 start_codon:yes stop_codon:yes gene_type:complete
MRAKNPKLKKTIIICIAILFFILGLLRVSISITDLQNKLPELLTGLIDLCIATWLTSLNINNLSNEFFATIVLMHSIATPHILRETSRDLHHLGQ